jgi:hypothetical protein
MVQSDLRREYAVIIPTVLHTVLCTDNELQSAETGVESGGGRGLETLALSSAFDSAMCALV